MNGFTLGYKSFTKIATETEKTANAFARRNSSLDQDQKYFRFNVEGLGDIGLDEHRRMRQVKPRTELYLGDTKNKRNFFNCAARLGEPGIRYPDGTHTLVQSLARNWYAILLDLT